MFNKSLNNIPNPLMATLHHNWLQSTLLLVGGQSTVCFRLHGFCYAFFTCWSTSHRCCNRVWMPSTGQKILQQLQMMIMMMCWL